MTSQGEAVVAVKRDNSSVVVFEEGLFESPEAAIRRIFSRYYVPYFKEQYGAIDRRKLWTKWRPLRDALFDKQEARIGNRVIYLGTA